MNKILTPKTANTYNKIIRLRRDNVSTPKNWFIVHENSVTIYEQKNGQEAVGKVLISKKAFERFIKFYETGI